MRARARVTACATLPPPPTLHSCFARCVLGSGEIYNYQTLAKELAGSTSAYKSDGFSLLPAYARWGERFPTRLRGEWAMVLVDMQRQRVILSTDAFATKPLWYASWRADDGKRRFAAASVRSALQLLGAPKRRIVHLAETPNQVRVLSWKGEMGFEAVAQHTLVNWDLRQHKNHTRDWIAAFRESVRQRSSSASLNRQNLLYVSMSSGYDSGAIGLALKLQGTKYAGFTFSKPDESGEDQTVIDARARANQALGGTMEYLQLTDTDMQSERKWLDGHAEPVPVTKDRIATWRSYLARRARAHAHLVHLSGQGSDEIISDYAIPGEVKLPCSCFGGVWPQRLESIFPWCTFYGGCQRLILLREEYAAGSQGVETRYPFLDVDVVQEYLWLTAEAKNSAYKRPVADFMREHSWPNAWGVKQINMAGSFKCTKKKNSKKACIREGANAINKRRRDDRERWKKWAQSAHQRKAITKSAVEGRRAGNPAGSGKRKRQRSTGVAAPPSAAAPPARALARSSWWRWG